MNPIHHLQTASPAPSKSPIHQQRRPRQPTHNVSSQPFPTPPNAPPTKPLTNKPTNAVPAPRIRPNTPPMMPLRNADGPKNTPWVCACKVQDTVRRKGRGERRNTVKTRPTKTSTIKHRPLYVDACKAEKGGKLPKQTDTDKDTRRDSECAKKPETHEAEKNPSLIKQPHKENPPSLPATRGTPKKPSPRRRAASRSCFDPAPKTNKPKPVRERKQNNNPPHPHSNSNSNQPLNSNDLLRKTPIFALTDPWATTRPLNPHET